MVGQRDSNSGTLAALTDGRLPVSEDDPSANFFFSAGSDGGRFSLDLGKAVDISQVNTYSWHSGARCPQVYNLYVSDGSDPKFNPAPDEKTHPAHCGWKLLATVDTRPKHGPMRGQYGVSINRNGASLGHIRYLLFDAVETEDDDPFGNTFFSEVDVVAK